ncbi:MAG: LytTR family transcriptional regulator [Pseudomonadota bacterium]|nr:LytTR family transcriptional regulator [Pseudomonadota bacterium]
MERSSGERPWSNPPLLLLTATIVMALLTAAEGAVYRHARGEPIAWASLVGLRLLDWSTCALFVAPLYLLIIRLPYDRRFWTVTAPVLVLATLAAAVLKYVVHTPLAGLADPAGARTILDALSADFLAKVMFYWGIVGLLYALALLRGDIVLRPLSAPAAIPAPHPPERLLVGDRRGMDLVPPDRIDWIEAQGNYCCIHSGGARRLVRRTLSSLLEDLAPLGFLQVHRSKAVNVHRVRRVESAAGQLRLVLADGSVVTSGRAFRAEVRRLIGCSSPQN